MIKGAIFDFDGTLVDSMFIWDTFGEDYIKSFGIEPKENLTETFKTFTLEQAAEYYRNNYDINLSVKEIVEGINNMVAEIYHTKVELKPGVRDFLKRLKSSGIKMCIATVTDRVVVENVLKRIPCPIIKTDDFYIHGYSAVSDIADSCCCENVWNEFYEKA